MRYEWCKLLLFRWPFFEDSNLSLFLLGPPLSVEIDANLLGAETGIASDCSWMWEVLNWSWIAKNNRNGKTMQFKNFSILIHLTACNGLLNKKFQHHNIFLYKNINLHFFIAGKERGPKIAKLAVFAKVLQALQDNSDIDWYIFIDELQVS